MKSLFVLFCVLLLQHSLGSQKTTAPPRVTSLRVTSEIKFRFASTLISSKLANEGAQSTKTVYDVIIPSEAFISNFSVEMKDSVYTGSIRERDTSRASYTTSGGLRNRPASMFIRPRNTNVFSVEVHMEPRSTLTFHLTYHEVLQRRLGTYKHTIYLPQDQSVPDLRVDVILQEPRDLTLLRVLPMTKRNWVTDVDTTPEIDRETSVSRPTSTSAHISYTPSIQSQTNMRDQENNGPMVVEYDVSRDKDAGDVLVLNGFFVHFFAPKMAEPVAKDILFILDTSSSMAVRKMEQLRSAMRSILYDIHPPDRFNILQFNTDTSFWRDNQMVVASESNIQSAVAFVKTLSSEGATNINEALTNGIEFLNQYASRDRGMLVFLTDGQASTGLTSNHAILAGVRSRNIHEIPIYSLAFGNDADWTFVKKVAVQNNGIGRRIYEDSDAPVQISGFYKEISTPLLRDVKFHYLNKAANESTVTQSAFKNYFNGSEVVVAGQLVDEETEVLSLVVNGSDGESDVDLKLKARTEELILADEPEQIGEITPFKNVPETMWAVLSIKDLLRRMDGQLEEGEREALKRRAVELSIKYNLVTPVTSMVLVFDGKEREERGAGLESDEEQILSDILTIHHGGWNSRGGRDPHFLLKTAWLDDQICFDVTGKARDVFRILEDPKLGLKVNIMLEPGRLTNKDGQKRTYITQMSMLLKKLVVVVKQNGVTINNRKYSWKDKISYKAPSVVISSNDSTSLVQVELKDGFSIGVYKHVPSDPAEGDQFLNLELNKEGRLSTKTTGLLGQFIHKRISMKKPRRLGKRILAQLELKTKNKLVKGLADLQIRRDPVLGTMSRCWLLHSGKGIFSIPQNHFLRKTITS